MSYRPPAYQDDSLCFGEKSTKLAELTARLTRPTYVYDLAQVDRRAKALQSAFPGAHLFYAMKANPHLEVLRCLRGAGLGADVVSGGEVARALEAGFDPSKIVFSGVGKTEEEIDFALGKNILQINVESLPELERIARRARALKTKARVAFRLNPDVDINTHPYIATGLKENKFGIELEFLPKIEEILRKESDVLTAVGLSLHLGSMMTDFSGLQEALKKLIPVFKDVRSRFPSVTSFDSGGGLGILYDRDDSAAEEKMLADYSGVIREATSDLGAQLQLEPGRWLLGHAGVLLAQVQYLKRTREKNFLILNTGMNHLIRPALYQAKHRLLPLLKHGARPRLQCDVVGPICESADFLARDLDLPELQEGEWVALLEGGAYGASMASVYNLQALPEEIVLK